MWFWALDQRRQCREKWKAEIREEVLEEGIEQGRAEADRELEEWLERARQMGLDVDSVPREQD